MTTDLPIGERLVGVAYPSFYVADIDAAVEFYARLLGRPETGEGVDFRGFPIGADRLTLFPARHGPHPDTGPRNAEFAIRVREPADVDVVHQKFVDLGARTVTAPRDTWMYRRMRFCCVDDPFGIRVDVFCPLPDGE